MSVRLDLKEAIDAIAQSREALEKITGLFGFKGRWGEPLDRVPSADVGVSVLCPYHDDHDPSGHIRLNELGEPVYECFAGCVAPTTFTSLFRLRELEEELPAPNLPALLYWQWKYRMLLRADVLDVDLTPPERLPLDNPRFQEWRHSKLRSQAKEKVERVYRGIFELMQIKQARFGNPATEASARFLVDWVKDISLNEALAIRTKLIEVGVFDVVGISNRYGRPTPILVPGNYAVQEKTMPVLLQETPKRGSTYNSATDPFNLSENIEMRKRQMARERNAGIKLQKATNVTRSTLSEKEQRLLDELKARIRNYPDPPDDPERKSVPFLRRQKSR